MKSFEFFEAIGYAPKNIIRYNLKPDGRGLRRNEAGRAGRKEKEISKFRYPPLHPMQLNHFHAFVAFPRPFACLAIFLKALIVASALLINAGIT